jgi:YVTN family beta-propeller protein
LSRAGAPLKWKYEPKPAAAAQGVACCDVVNRGAVYADGKIVFNTLDVQTVAVDANSGKEIWKTKLGDINRGETITMAPLIVKNKVLVGNSGGEMGVRGWLTALDLSNGRGAPKTATVAVVLLAIALSVSGTALGAELRVFVTNEKSDNVTVLQAGTHKVLDTISVGQRPRGISASRDGRRVFVANSNSNNLSVIDSKTLPVLRANSTFPQIPGACALAQIRATSSSPTRRRTRFQPSMSQAASYSNRCPLAANDP